MGKFNRSLRSLAIAASALSSSSFVNADEYVVKGNCVFANPWSSWNCKEFRGDAWTDESMKKVCDIEMEPVLNSGEPCSSKDGVVAGWCVKTIDDDEEEAKAKGPESS